jgi:bifunctional oligoribonuclease and PAP phosphatase NrnA
MYYPEYASLFENLLKELHGKKVAILSHVRPDGDSIGSQLALCRILRKCHIDAIMLADVLPRSFLSFIADTPVYPSAALALEDYLPIFVDCADVSRVEKPLEKTYPKPFLNIDHHKSNTAYAAYNIVDDGAAATAEIITALCCDAKIPLDAITAQALFLGIASDTGQFLYASTSARVFELVTYLVKHGARPDALDQALYQNEPLQKLQLLQRFLASIRLEWGGKIAVATLSSQDYAATETSREHSEGFVNYIRSIDSVCLAVFTDYNDQDQALKLSLRAKDAQYRLDLLAQKFGGGGHACAAGLTVQESHAVFLPRFLSEAVAHIQTRAVL